MVKLSFHQSISQSIKQDQSSTSQLVFFYFFLAHKRKERKEKSCHPHHLLQHCRWTTFLLRSSSVMSIATFATLCLRYFSLKHTLNSYVVLLNPISTIILNLTKQKSKKRKEKKNHPLLYNQSCTI